VLLGGARSVATGVAFLGALLGVIFVPWPSLKPEGPSQTENVTLEKVTLDRKVTQLIDAESGDQLDQSRDLSIVAQVTNEQGTWDVWVPTPKGHLRRLFVQIQLYDRPGGVPLGRLRTRLFASA
jgi:hypothetical protein